MRERERGGMDRMKYIEMRKAITGYPLTWKDRKPDNKESFSERCRKHRLLKEEVNWSKP